MSAPRHPCLLAALILAGCAAGPDYSPPPVTVAPQWHSPVNSAPVDLAWWKRFNDPLLTELIEQANAGNLDVKQAEARLREARALQEAAAGGRQPQLNASASATRNQLSRNGQLPVANIPGFDRRFPLFDGGFDASWEIDLWGYARRTLEAAGARAEAASEARHAVMLQTAAEVARTYVQLRGAQARLASAQTDADAQDRIASLVGQRTDAGEAARFDLVRARGRARTTRSVLAGLDADVRDAAYRLALLTGRPPEALMERLATPSALPAPPDVLLAGLRSDLLRRRPDIRQAERELAAATADVGVATANLFPRLSLVGSIGQQARSGGDLASAGSTRFQIGPSLHWPVFAGGTLRAQVRAAKARADGAGARYEQAVLQALTDSEGALNRYAATRLARADRESAGALSRQALHLSTQRYRAGEDDLLVLLDAQSADSQAQRQSIDARVDELTAAISAYKALGGGWQALDQPLPGP